MWKPAVILTLVLIPILVFAQGSETEPAKTSTTGVTATGAATTETKPADKPTSPVFVDATATVGLDFEHFNGMSGEFYFSETPGGGGALFDFDGDGDLDLFIVQGKMLDENPLEKATLPPKNKDLRGRLYRNDLKDGKVRFTDVTTKSGIDARGYGMGAATGDIDNDGNVDLYVTNFGPNQLWRNHGDGTFSDVTETSRVLDREWSVSAAFVDYDRDGDLDLFLGNYLDFRINTHRPCFGASGVRDYCGPNAYRAEQDRLFRNRGDGTFDEVSKAAGLEADFGGALGVISGDFDSDGWLDIYVANDQLPNQQWMNQGDGTFENLALLGGSAVNSEGLPEASMGVDAGDIDGDGDEDLFMAHLSRETNTLYRNDGQGFFSDTTASSGLDLASFSFTGFGTKFIDYDNDGRLDILVVNGAVKTIEALARKGDPYPLHQTNQLFHNLGEGRFEDVTPKAGDVFTQSDVSRGASFGDIDNDGDTDVVIFNNAGPTRVWLNQVGQNQNWLGIIVHDPKLNRDAFGAHVTLHLPDKTRLSRRVRTDGSYASGNDPRLLFGLGDVKRVERIEIEWVGGERETWEQLSINDYITLRRGTGSTKPSGNPSSSPS